jgi:hypothetical protein
MLRLLLWLIFLSGFSAQAQECSELFQQFARAGASQTDTTLKSESRLLEQAAIARAREVLAQWDSGRYGYFDPEFKRLVDELQLRRRTLIERVEKLKERRTQLRRMREKFFSLFSASRKQAVQEEKQVIEAELMRLSQELSDSSEILNPARQILGTMVIHAAGVESARASGALILLRHTRSPAAAQLAHKGLAKGTAFKFHSSWHGVISGLLPYDQTLSKVAAKGAEEVARMQALVDQAIQRGEVAAVPYRLGNLVAVKREGTVKFLDKLANNISEEEIVKVLAVKDTDGGLHILVSDVDPFAFALGEGKGLGTPRKTLHYGIITDKEKEILKEYNHQFRRLLGAENNNSRVMLHGAENRNPNVAKVEGYPISAHFPDGEVRIIQEGPPEDRDMHLKAFYREAREKGFSLEENPLWAW